MRDIVTIIKRLKAVRKARQAFVLLHIIGRPVEQVRRGGARKRARADCNDWSFLYSGSVLDD